MRHRQRGANGNALGLFLRGSLLTLILFAVVAAAIQPAGAQQATELFMSDGEETAAPAEDPVVVFDALTTEERRALLARMSDSDVRRLVLDQLGTAEEPPEVGESHTFDDRRLRTALGETFSSGPEVVRAFVATMAALREGQVEGFIGYVVLAFAGFLVGGAIVEVFFRWLTRGIRRRLASAAPERLLPRMGYLLLRIALDLVTIGVFFAAAFGVFLLVEQGHEPARIVVLSYLTDVLVIRAFWVLARFVLAPNAPALRLFDLTTPDARAIFRWVVASAIFLVITFTTSDIAEALGGMSWSGQRLYGFSAGALFMFILLGTVLRARRPIADLIRVGARPRSFRIFAANFWHIPALVYLLLIFVISVIQANLAGVDTLFPGIASLMLLALLPILDTGVCRGMGEYFGRHTQLDDEIALPNYEPVIRRTLRILLFFIAVLVLLGLWGVPLGSVAESGTGGRIASGIASVALTILIAYVLWQIIRVSIDRKLILEGGGDTHAPTEVGGEGGGAPMSRISTLLPLIRSFLLVLIVVVAAMVALSSIGVNIGPLIAGAGIVGVAIGFGAQTLVRDIVSGLFFLWDDAFRVGEYVELGFVKGTVEGISIRSMRLRHHRGALHTVPYGEIKHLTNHSRDWVIMKLEFRVTYDTDVMKVKKIFKRIGAELAEDPEMGPNLLQPLKSQGVLRMEDSAMIVRAKFMAKPGEQFVIRREAFTRIQKAFAEAGIEFAHRRVTVEVPKDATPEEAEKIKEAASSAAALEEPTPAPAGAPR